MLRVVRRVTSFLESEAFDLLFLSEDLALLLSALLSSVSVSLTDWFSVFSLRASLMVMTRFLFSKTCFSAEAGSLSSDSSLLPSVSFLSEPDDIFCLGPTASFSIASCLAFHLSLREDCVVSPAPILSFSGVFSSLLSRNDVPGNMYGQS